MKDLEKDNGGIAHNDEESDYDNNVEDSVEYQEEDYNLSNESDFTSEESGFFSSYEEDKTGENPICNVSFFIILIGAVVVTAILGIAYLFAFAYNNNVAMKETNYILQKTPAYTETSNEYIFHTTSSDKIVEKSNVTATEDASASVTSVTIKEPSGKCLPVAPCPEEDTTAYLVTPKR